MACKDGSQALCLDTPLHVQHKEGSWANHGLKVTGRISAVDVVTAAIITRVGGQDSGGTGTLQEFSVTSAPFCCED